jgi:chromosome segregation ATPase
MGAKTAFLLLRKYMERREELLTQLRPMQSRYEHLNDEWAKMSASISKQLEEGKLELDDFRVKMNKLFESVMGQLGKIEKDMEPVKHELQHNSEQSRPLLNAIGKRLNELTPDFVKHNIVELNTKIIALKKVVPRDDAKIAALEKKVASWSTFAKAGMPLNGTIAGTLKQYQAELNAAMK